MKSFQEVVAVVRWGAGASHWKRKNSLVLVGDRTVDVDHRQECEYIRL